MNKEKSKKTQKSLIRIPAYLFAIVFITITGYTASSMYWIFKKDNEIEKFRRLELDLQNQIKERDLRIHQFQQSVEQLERRVEILDAIKKISHADVTEQDQKKIARVVYEESEKYGHDPLFLVALMSTESSMRSWIESGKGAQGLMQLLPGTGNFLLEKIEQDPRLIGLKEGETIPDMSVKDIEGNVRLGTLYLTKLMLRFNSMEEAVYAYILGPALYEKRKQSGGPMPNQYLGRVVNKYRMLVENRDRKHIQTPTILALADEQNMLAQADLVRVQE